jgi:uncharacterized membrane protein YGL010W
MFFVYIATVFSSKENAFAIGAGLFVIGWIAQLIGHYVFEKRSPALFDNIKCTCHFLFCSIDRGSIVCIYGAIVFSWI